MFCVCVAGHRAVYVLPAIVPCMWLVLQVLETSRCRRGAAEISFDPMMFSFDAGDDPVGSPSRSTSVTRIVLLAVAGLPAPRRLTTAPARHGPAILTPPPP